MAERVPCENTACVFISGHDGECSDTLNNRHIEAMNRARESMAAQYDGGFDPDIFALPQVHDTSLPENGPAYVVHPPQIHEVSIHEASQPIMQYSVDGLIVPTEQAMDILSRLLPEWRDLFLAKNAKYKAVGNDLGARGVFPDINRKTGILKDRIWDGNSSPGESSREVILDLIGHLFLMLHMMDKEQRDGLR